MLCCQLSYMPNELGELSLENNLSSGFLAHVSFEETAFKLPFKCMLRAVSFMLCLNVCWLWTLWVLLDVTAVLNTLCWLFIVPM